MMPKLFFHFSRNFDDNWHNEFGPMRIPKTHSLTRELVSRFKLRMAPFYNQPHAFFVEDKRISQHEYVQVLSSHFISGHSNNKWNYKGGLFIIV